MSLMYFSFVDVVYVVVVVVVVVVTVFAPDKDHFKGQCRNQMK